jgi:hypothetical protein
MCGGKSDPGLRGRRWKVADFDPAIIEEFDDDRFDRREAKAKLVRRARLKDNAREDESGLRRSDRIANAPRFRLVGKERS